MIWSPVLTVLWDDFMAFILYLYPSSRTQTICNLLYPCSILESTWWCSRHAHTSKSRMTTRTTSRGIRMRWYSLKAHLKRSLLKKLIICRALLIVDSLILLNTETLLFTMITWQQKKNKSFELLINFEGVVEIVCPERLPWLLLGPKVIFALICTIELPTVLFRQNAFQCFITIDG
jgi:hypothetical protein